MHRTSGDAGGGSVPASECLPVSWRFSAARVDSFQLPLTCLQRSAIDVEDAGVPFRKAPARQHGREAHTPAGRVACGDSTYDSGPATIRVMSQPDFGTSLTRALS